MKRKRPPVPEDIREALVLIKQGKVFALQEWIEAGKRVRCPDVEEHSGCCLKRACNDCGHSIIEVLLSAGGWSQNELSEGLSKALQAKRLDLVELFLSHDADPRSADFGDVAKTADVDLMERFLRAGCDPTKDNGFARALDETKARPLLRFLRNHIETIPGLRNQASLALAEAVDEEKVGWSSMLVWAGADPMMKVPEKLWKDWGFSDYQCRSAADIACDAGNADLIKVLKLKPTIEEAPLMLYRVASSNSPDALKQFLRSLPKKMINDGDPPSCYALESFLTCEPYRGPWGEPYEERVLHCAKCLEMLLEASAQWNPDEDTLKRIQRRFWSLSPRYAARIIRLFLYVPNAVNREVVLNFCNHSRVRRTLQDGDERLLKEMEKMENREERSYR